MKAFLPILIIHLLVTYLSFPIYRKSVCCITDAKFHIMDSGTEYTEQFSVAIICPQSGSRLSHLLLLRFRRLLSKTFSLKSVYTYFLIKSSIIFVPDSVNYSPERYKQTRHNSSISRKYPQPDHPLHNNSPYLRLYLSHYLGGFVTLSIAKHVLPSTH